MNALQAHRPPNCASKARGLPSAHEDRATKVDGKAQTTQVLERGQGCWACNIGL